MRSDANVAGVCPAGSGWRCVLKAVSDRREAGVVRRVEDEAGGALEADSSRGGVDQGIAMDSAVGNGGNAVLAVGSQAEGRFAGIADDSVNSVSVYGRVAVGFTVGNVLREARSAAD